MEEKPSSKKRKHSSSSNPFIGIVTRSESQMYIHRNRSGQSRSDSVAGKIPDAEPNWSELSPKRKVTSAVSQESFDTNEISRISIKDLRARRVFSPASSIDDECCSKVGEIGEVEKCHSGFHCKIQNLNGVCPNPSTTVEDCCNDKDNGNGACSDDAKTIEKLKTGFCCEDQGLNDMNPDLLCTDKEDKISACLDHTTPTKTEGIEKLDKGFPFKPQELNNLNHNLSANKRHGRFCNAEQGNHVDAEVLNGDDGSMGDCVQTTPPDADIFSMPEVDENGGNNVEFVLHSVSHDLRKPSNECIRLSNSFVGEGFSANIDRRSGSISKSKLVLNPCSRLKVFKNPNSFSYRRLLPFLMGIAKDSSCAPKNGQCPKLDKGLEVKAVPPLLASQSQEISIEKSSEIISPMGLHVVDSGSTPRSILTPATTSSNGNEPNSSSPGEITEYRISFDSQEGQALKTEQVLSDKPSKLEPANVNVTPIPGTDSPVMSLYSPSKAQDLNSVNPNLFATEENGKICNAEQGSDIADCEVLNVVDGLLEDCVQTTPIDASIFGKPEFHEHGGNKVYSVLQASDHDLGLPLNGNICMSNSFVGEVLSENSDRRNNSICKSKLVLNPCSRMKVFKTHNSFSYRRLLPFLMDITKDNSCAPRNSQCPKVEKCLELIQVPPLLASHNQEIFIDKSTADSSPMVPHIVDSGAMSKPILIPANISSNGNEPNSTPLEDFTESKISFDSQKDQALRVEQVISDRPSKSEPAHDNASPICGTDSPVMSLCSPVSPEFLHRESVIEVSHHSPTDAKKDSNTSAIEFTTDAASLDQFSSQLEAIVPTGNPAVSLTKGILKQNPRGCRGLCTCLNCASFRLHAERAFEFSRNQMQDAEEVALELIKELSFLRNMLETATNDANDHVVVRLNQVKDACGNASKAEELAKARLSQMNYDLNIHCRIRCLQRPRVRFSNNVQEKVIPKADLPRKSPKE